jgi:phosphoribosyl-dephospho-CoA transferase
MKTYKRHDLVWISGKGKDFAVENIQSCIPPVTENEIRDFLFSLPPLPAIVTRQDERKSKFINIGFSFPRIIGGVRLRVRSKIPFDCITERKTPFDVALCVDNSPFSEILNRLIHAGSACKTKVGFFGSAALQIVTGLSYIQNNSDIDLYIRHLGNCDDLAKFFETILKIEEHFKISVDAEIEYRKKYGVKLKELFGPGKTVLGKGLYEAALLEKNMNWALCD